MVQLLKLMNDYWYILLTKVRSLFRLSLVFASHPFSVLRSQQVQHITFSHLVSLGSCWLWHFLRLSFFSVTLIILSTGHLFCRMSNRNFSDVFLMMKPGLWVFWGKATEKKCHSHNINTWCLLTCILSTWLITIDVALGHLA